MKRNSIMYCFIKRVTDGERVAKAYIRTRLGAASLNVLVEDDGIARYSKKV